MRNVQERTHRLGSKIREQAAETVGERAVRLARIAAAMHMGMAVERMRTDASPSVVESRPVRRSAR